MKTLENAKRTVHRTMGRIIAAATFGAIAIAAAPVQAAEQAVGISDALYRTGESQVSRQNEPRLVEAEFSVGINLGHGFGHGGYYGHQKKYYGHQNNNYGHHKNYYGHQKNYYGHRNNFRSNRSFNRGGRQGFSNGFRGGRQSFSRRGNGRNFGSGRSSRRGFGGRR